MVGHKAQGRDVSDFQPVQSAASWDGYSFGIAKATEGTGWSSVTYGANMMQMRLVQASRPFYPGAYHFLHPGEDPVAQARFFVSAVRSAGLRPGDLLAADVEILSGVSAADHPRNHAEVTAADLLATPANVDAAAMAFLDEVRFLVGDAHPLIVYTMHDAGQHLAETSKRYPLLWFASPGTPPSADMIAPFTSWLVWQWSWAGGSLGDLDSFNGAPGDLESLVGSYLRGHRPYRHMASGSESLAAVAVSRRTTVAHLTAQTIEAQIPRILRAVANGASAELAEFARYLDRPGGAKVTEHMPAGLVYYTTNP